MIPSMHCDITLFVVTIVEFHVLIYDDFVQFIFLEFSCKCFYNTVDIMLQFFSANMLLAQHNR